MRPVIIAQFSSGFLAFETKKNLLSISPSRLLIFFLVDLATLAPTESQETNQ